MHITCTLYIPHVRTYRTYVLVLVLYWYYYVPSPPQFVAPGRSIRVLVAIRRSMGDHSWELVPSVYAAQLVSHGPCDVEPSSSSAFEWWIPGPATTQSADSRACDVHREGDSVPCFDGDVLAHSSMTCSQQSGVPSVQNCGLPHEDVGDENRVASCSGNDGELCILNSGMPCSMAPDWETERWTFLNFLIEAWMTLPLQSLFTAHGTARMSCMEFAWTHQEPSGKVRPARIRLWKVGGNEGSQPVQFSTSNGCWTTFHGSWAQHKDRSLHAEFKYNFPACRQLVKHELWQIRKVGHPQEYWCDKREGHKHHLIRMVLCSDAGSWLKDVLPMLIAAGWQRDEIPPLLEYVALARGALC